MYLALKLTAIEIDFNHLSLFLFRRSDHGNGTNQTCL